METLFEHINILVLTKPSQKEDHDFVLPPQIPVLKKARISKNHQLFLIQEPHHALEAAMRLQHQHPTQSIALGHGHVLCIEDQPNHASYHGDSLHELVQLMPKLPTGHPILTSAFYERLLPWEDDDILLSPIQQQTLTPLMNTLYTLHEQDTQPHKIRSNINHINTPNFAHTHTINTLIKEFAEHSLLQVCGAYQSGKSLLAQHACISLLYTHPALSCWWIDASRFTTRQHLTAALEMLWNTTLNTSDEHLELPHVNSQLIVLDGCDQLDDHAITLLENLSTQDQRTSWMITSSKPRFASWKTITTQPLTSSQSLAILLDPRHNHTAPSFNHALKIVDSCQGNPSALLVARKHHQDTQEFTPQSLRDHIQHQWHKLSPSEHHVLTQLAQLSTSYHTEELHKFIKETAPDSAPSHMLQKLIDMLLVQQSQASESLSFGVPRHIAHALPSHTDSRPSRVWSSALLHTLDGLLDDLHTGHEHTALIKLRNHQPDLLNALEHTIVHDPTLAITIIIKLRAYHQRQHTTFDYLPWITRAQSHPELSQEHRTELMLSEAICLDHMAGRIDDAQQRFEQCAQHAEHLNTLSRFDLYYHYAIYTEDKMNSEEEFNLAKKLLQQALELIPDDDHTQSARLSGAYNVLAQLAMQKGDHQEARRQAERAQHHAHLSQSVLRTASSSFTLHRILHLAGELDAAEHAARQAQFAYEKAGLVSGIIMTLASRGYIAIKRNEDKRAQNFLHQALTISKERHHKFGQMNCSHLLAVSYMLSSKWDEAFTYFQEAQHLQRELGITWNEHQTKIVMTLMYSARGEIMLAKEAIQQAEEFFKDQPDPEIMYSISLMKLAPDIYEQAFVHEDRDALLAIEARIQTIEQEYDKPASSSTHIHILRRYLNQAKSHLDNTTDSSNVFFIKDDASVFQIPGTSEEINIARKRTVKRILKILLDLRQEHPGEIIEAHDLVEQGWPGDRGEVRSGLMRLYVTINTLRGLGLEEILQTHGEGYRLDPDVPLKVLA